MSSFPALSRLRIGCVRYLNSKPLIQAYPGPVVFDHPSALAPMLAARELDLALIPMFEILRSPGYRVVDNVAIASIGKVYSVFVAYQGELKSVGKIKADPASMTSVNLMQVLLREFHGISPELCEAGEAELLIGNQAIAFRQQHGDRYRYLDLGEDWLRCTGLPFVFAGWALGPGVPVEAAEEVRQLRAESFAMIEEIVAGEPDHDFAREYLTERIRFDLGPAEKDGIALFAKLLAKHGLCAPSAGLAYV